MRAILLALLLAAESLGAGTTISVAAGGDLQAAIDRAVPGDTIELEAGATFVGRFTLPKKDGDAVITIRTAGSPAVAEDQRVTPADAKGFAKLKAADNQPALQTASGAHHWRLLLLEIQGSAQGERELVSLGDGSPAQRSAADVPHDLVVDRCYIHGDAATGQRRCVALQSAATSVVNSYISDCKRVGAEAQAIGGWNGPGPFVITNNYLEGAGENIMFGGADPAIDGLVPSDIAITNNTIAKPAAWRGERWEVKNLLELKNARRVTITGNTIEYSWAGAQSGYAVLFTVRNQNGGCPWCEVSEVTFANNTVRHAGGGVSILGVDNNHPGKQTHDIIVRSNVFSGLDNQLWGGNGYFLLITGGPRDVTIDGNTIVQDHGAGIVQVEGPPIRGFVFTNNIARHLSYGIIGTDHAPGADTISTYFPGSKITGNSFAGAEGRSYPGNRNIGDICDQLISCTTGDFRPRTPQARP